MKVGDVVRVKGIPGPAMRVVEARGDAFGCHWFDTENHLQFQILPPDDLEPADAGLEREKRLAEFMGIAIGFRRGKHDAAGLRLRLDAWAMSAATLLSEMGIPYRVGSDD